MSAPESWMESYVERVSADGFAPTLARLKDTVLGAGMTIFAEIDHAAAAEAVGMAMPPTTVLIYGNPRGGTPVMQASPEVALDLPLRVLIREHEGRTLIGFHPIAGRLRSAGVPSQLVEKLEGAQLLLTGLPLTEGVESR